MDCIDVFGGAGGAAIGLRKAGFEHVLAIEMNPFAAISFGTAFPRARISTKNLFLFSFREICDENGISPKWYGLAWLSPPCQGHSSAGAKGGESDVRNRLLFKAVETADYLPNAWIAIENVEGLMSENSKPILDKLKTKLAIKRQLAIWVVRAADWGMPTERNRVFIIASPEGWTGAFPLEPIAPKDIDCQTTKSSILGGFTDHDPEFRALPSNEAVINSEIGSGQNYKASRLGLNYAALKFKGRKPPENFLRRPSLDGPFPCLTASISRCGSRVALIHPEKLRELSVGEQKRLMGLPDELLVAGSLDERVRQAGNAVMPFMSELVGRKILNAIESTQPDAPAPFINKNIQGDALAVLRTLPDQLANCSVTSPPYWMLRDYHGVKGQLGQEATLNEYISSMVRVFGEVRRVLRNDGTLWLNMGDKMIDKRLLGIPWRLALAMVDDGWILRQEIIWNKSDCTPESAKDRPTRSHEQIFLFSKCKRYYYDCDAIREKTGKEMSWDEYEKALGNGWKAKTTKKEDDQLMGKNRLKMLWHCCHPNGKNKRSVWTLSTKQFSNAGHFASFPEKLIEPCILAGCPKKGLVLDPFMGSGTTAVVARQHGRNYLGIELNSDYIKIAEQRLRADGDGSTKTSA